MANNKVKDIDNKYFSFFSGIALCLFSVVLILNVGYVARLFALPFLYLFGLGSFIIYILTYAYGLYLFFKEKRANIKFNHIAVGIIVIFISALMISTLIVLSKDDPLKLNNFANRYKDVINNVDVNKQGTFNGYWSAKFINVFSENKFGGGFIGYFLVALFSFNGAIASAWFFSILILLIGAFIIFYPQIKKILGINKTKKVKEEKPERSVSINKNSYRVENYDAIATANRIDNNEERVERVQESPLPYPNNNQINPSLTQPFTGNSNFTPALFNKFLAKPLVAPNVTKEEPITPEQALLKANKESAINEQLQLNFDEKPMVNEELLATKPEFLEPVNAPKTYEAPAYEEKEPVMEEPQPTVQEEAVVRKPIKWVPPSSALLETIEIQDALDANNALAEERMIVINQFFADFKIGAHCTSFVVGPGVTRYDIEYDSNVSVKSVEKLISDISIRLKGASARFEQIVEGKNCSGLEVPNAKITTVSFKEVYESLPEVKKHPLKVVFGKSIDGKYISADFDEFPHLLVAGTTGSGKSIFNHSVICTLIMRNSPEDLKLVMIDPKQVEFSKYEGMPHLLCPIIDDANIAKLTLSKLVDEMNRRYKILKDSGCSNIKQYNELREENPILEKMPYIVVFIDEYADLVDVCKDISQPIVSIAQKARAAGIHMLIATQRPSTNVITGVIKANLPTRVALMVASATDSITILGEGGAETLLGKGDMLVQSPLVSRVGMVRLQGCFIQNKEILHIVGYLKEHYECMYDPNFCNLETASKQEANQLLVSNDFQAMAENSEEDKYQAVKEFVMANEYMSMSKIQRDMGVGFNRAGRFFKRLQQEGVVGTVPDGNKGCPVLVHDKFYDGNPDTDIPVSYDVSE